MTQHWKGPDLPNPGDNILPAWAAFAQTAGIIVKASDVAAARLILDKAEADSVAPTADNPAYFAIGKNLYRSDGIKNDSSVWTLEAINETECVQQTYVGTGGITKAAGESMSIITSSLPTRNYDRLVVAFGLANASTTNVNGLRITINGATGNTARWEKDSSNESTMVVNTAVIKAGVTPSILLEATWGGTGNSTVKFSTAADANRLISMAWPISMGA